MSFLALPPEGRILDLACGYGRIAVPLARRGFQVTGLDLSKPLLAIARERAAQAGVTVEWRRADMRDIPSEWSGQFDAVISIWNSFGYFRRRSREPARACQRSPSAQARWPPAH